MTTAGTDIRKVQIDIPESDDVLVFMGEMPASYMVAGTGSRGRRVYHGANSDDTPYLQVTLGKEEQAQLPPHVGLRYKIVLEPIPPAGKRPDG
ncbi:MAG: hypothetical protein DRO99_05290 [Candidatus Aenigmatarchaeota archaeon]|nr:MAG: hypothetical protein DRO99_05290 [Candidatus Aenigmarchaeota archaeon]